MAKQRKHTPRDLVVDQAIEDYIKENYGSKHTVYSGIVDEALNMWLCFKEVPGFDQYNVVKKEPGYDFGSTHKKPLKPRQLKLLEDFYWQSLAVSKLSDDKLTQFIRETLFIKDPRSIQGHKEFLEGLGWITPIKNTNLVDGTDQVVAWKVSEISQSDIEKFIPDIHSPVRNLR